MKRYVMIGAPVTTVRTPALLTEYLRGIGVAAEIETRHVDPGDLDAFMSAANADSSIDGLLVTMPHKRTIIPYLENISAVARRAGSVNAAKRGPGGRLVGAQYDGIALVNALLVRDVPVATSNILLAGIGGAGLPIAQAILAHGCKRLAISDASAAAVAKAVESLRELGPVAAYDGGDHDILVNATPLGMRDGDMSPFDEAQIAKAVCVADIVADPPKTRLAAMARAANVPVVTGRDMVGSQVKPIGDWLLASGLEQ
jgi:shikimate dehydrogenase